MNTAEVQKYFEKKRQHLTKEEYKTIKKILDKIQKKETDIDVDLAEQLKDKGNEEYKSGDYEASLNSYTQAIIYNPHNAVYYSNKAAALSKLCRVEEAIECCKNGLNVDNKFIKLYLRLGNLYAKTDRSKAIDILDKGLLINPDNEAILEQKEALVKLPEEKKEEKNKGDINDILGKMNLGSSEGVSFDMGSLLGDKGLNDMIQNFVKDKSPEELSSMMNDMMNQLGMKK